MNASAAHRYLDRYPLGGGVALLCEGDWAGYEAHLLRGWTAARVQPHGVFVDIWPCGTAGSLYGMADALGRMRPIVVIEDRDYRDPQLAERECDSKKKDRQERGVHVTAWQTWKRHEIENYFLEPSVLLPVMAQAFGVSVDEVQQRVCRLLSVLAVDQAAQYAIYQMRHPWTDRNLPGHLPPGIPRKEARPRWDQQQNSIVAPSQDEVEGHLKDAINKGEKALKKAASSIAPDDALDAFHEKCDQWCDMTLERRQWRIDWAGKELLAYLRQWLAAEFGWLNKETGAREQLDWESMSRRERDERDREIEHAIQPLLVRELLAVLSKAPSGDRWEDGMRDEWQELAKACLRKGAESGAGPAEE